LRACLRHHDVDHRLTRLAGAIALSTAGATFDLAAILELCLGLAFVEMILVLVHVCHSATILAVHSLPLLVALVGLGADRLVVHCSVSFTAACIPATPC
jgi:hypothetical protein